MKNIILISIFIQGILSSCEFFKPSECEGNIKFDTEHNSMFNLYHKGDTIFFINDIGLLDTIVVVEKLEWVQNCMLTSKEINIKHLPRNKWISGYEGTKSGFKPLNQSLLSMGKEIAPKGYDRFSEYSIYIAYRNFNEKFEDSLKANEDELFSYLGINKYFTIKNKQKGMDSLDVSEIFWSNKFGLIGYKLKNDCLYKIKI